MSVRARAKLRWKLLEKVAAVSFLEQGGNQSADRPATSAITPPISVSASSASAESESAETAVRAGAQ